MTNPETYSVKPIPTNKRDRIRQYSSRKCIGWANSSAWNHGHLGLLGHQSWVELDVGRVLVQVPQLLCDFGVRVDLLERFILLEPEELAELVEGADAPSAGLLDTQDLDCFEHLGDIASAKRSYLPVSDARN